MNAIDVRLEVAEFVNEQTPLPFSLVIANEGTLPRDLHLQGREIVFDLSVIGDGGLLVWRRLAGAMVQAIVRLETLEPGESITLGDVWDQRDSSGAFVEPGFYTLQGSVPTDGDPLLSRDRLLQVLRV